MSYTNRFNVTVATKFTNNEGTEKTRFTRVGVAFENTSQDGSKTLNVKLDFPVAVTEFVLFEYKAKDSDDDNVTD